MCHKILGKSHPGRTERDLKQEKAKNGSETVIVNN